jgi:hypothetical protein
MAVCQSPGWPSAFRGGAAEQFELGTNLAGRHGYCSGAKVREDSNGLALRGRSG